MDRDSINGHVAPANYSRDDKLELLNTSGTVVAIENDDTLVLRVKPDNVKIQVARSSVSSLVTLLWA